MARERLKSMAWNAAVATLTPTLIILGVAVARNEFQPTPLRAAAIVLVPLLPGMTAVALADPDPQLRRTMSATSAVTTAIAIMFYGALTIEYARCQPVSPVGGALIAAFVALPAAGFMWAVVANGSAFTVRRGLLGAVLTLALGALATIAVGLVALLVALASGCWGY